MFYFYSVQEYGEIVFTFPVIVLVQLFLRFINVYLYVTLDLMTFFFFIVFNTFQLSLYFFVKIFTQFI